MRWSGKIARVYDLWWSYGQRRARELAFWQQAVSSHFTAGDKPYSPHNIRVVELFSGTGRVTLAVARRLLQDFPSAQIEVIGLDFSPDMRAIFTENLEGERDERLRSIASSRHLDLRDTDWSSVLDQFDSVDVFLCPFNHISLMGDATDQKHVLRQVAAYLKDQGEFIFLEYAPAARLSDTGETTLDYVVSEAPFLRQSDRRPKRALFCSRRSWPVDPLHRRAFKLYDVTCVEWLDTADGGGGGGVHVERLTRPMIASYLEPECLDELLRENNLHRELRLAGYEGAEFRPADSPRQIVFARKGKAKSPRQPSSLATLASVATTSSGSRQPLPCPYGPHPVSKPLSQPHPRAAIWNARTAEIYDLWWSPELEDVTRFWPPIVEECFRSRESRDHPFHVVAPFAGTGRVLLPVAQHLVRRFPDQDFRFTAIDASQPMLDVIEEKLRHPVYQGLRGVVHSLTTFVEDSWNLPFPADVVLCPFNHLGLLGSEEAQEAFVGNVAKNLEDGGSFILEEYNADEHRRQFDTGKKNFRWMITDQENARVLFYWFLSSPIDRSHRHAQIAYAVDCVEWRDCAAGLKGVFIDTIVAPMIIRYHTPEQLSAFLCRHNLHVEDAWQDSSRTPLSSQSCWTFFRAKRQAPSPLSETGLDKISACGHGC